jgi:hypothetical protein
LSAAQVTPTADISQIAIRKAAELNANGVPYVKKSIPVNAFLFRRLLRWNEFYVGSDL